MTRLVPLQFLGLPEFSALDAALVVTFAVSTVTMTVIYGVYLVVALRDWRADGPPRPRDDYDPTLRERLAWWVLFSLPTATIGYLLVGVAAARFLFALPFTVLSGLVLGLLGLHLVAPVAFHVESAAVRRRTSWDPSGVYYLTIVATGLGALLGALYLYQRHRHLRAAASEAETANSVAATDDATDADDAPDADDATESAVADSDGGVGPARLPAVSRRNLLQVGAVGYAGYMAYQFAGPWLENEATQLLFGSAPDLTGDPTGWPMRNYGPRQTAANPSARPPSGDLAVETLYTGRDPNAEDGPVYADGTLYFCDRPEVRAIDAETGETRWTYRRKETGPFADGETWAVPHAIATDGESVFVSIDLGLAALDAETGEKRWHYETNALFRDLTVAGNTAFLGDYGVTAVDTATGAKRWRAEWNTGPSTPAAVADGTVFATHNASTDDGNHGWVVRAFDGSTGDAAWTRRVDFGSEGHAANTPVVDGTLYVGGDHLFALDAETGETRWKRENAVAGDWGYRLAADGDRLYAIPGGSGTESGSVRAFDAANGDPLWSMESPPDTDVAGTVAGETLCLTYEEEFRLVDGATGERLRSLDRDFGFPDPPRTVEDRIFVEGWEELFEITAGE
ncbi:PQQ-binding-like beta-propeller repeat protein [Halorussus gelatinilyticus]|uniref:PQQ-binding-like beta-propeller repeat protein n=1 Tax=Halorussus gelatinilyticus TaxID=2937524 RepID=A0A8U0IPV0_9EURY|nr:PQQ-binding-like beta-propeller repeat protein [Halorussus gelatinilyticus]UPW02039.1 PQQ-binding-like beta-propeller repeat protein [Halorussus gelatinilyticus]